MPVKTVYLSKEQALIWERILHGKNVSSTVFAAVCNQPKPTPPEFTLEEYQILQKLVGAENARHVDESTTSLLLKLLQKCKVHSHEEACRVPTSQMTGRGRAMRLKQEQGRGL